MKQDEREKLEYAHGLSILGLMLLEGVQEKMGIKKENKPITLGKFKVNTETGKVKFEKGDV